MRDSKDIIFIESRKRTLIKSFTYRVLSIIGTGGLTWLITREMKEAISVTIAIQIFLMILYYSYERVWNKINWGKETKEIFAENEK